METTEIYKGFDIKIQTDDSPLNPFEDCEGNLPLAYYSGRNNYKDYSKGDISEYLSNVLTDGQIILHQQKIADAFEIDLEYMKVYEFGLDQKVSDIRLEISSSTDFDAWEVICKIGKIPYLNTNSRGYSQGDYADIFTCYTTKFEAVNGSAMKDVDDSRLQGAVDLWSAWCWNDVYGYTVEDMDDLEAIVVDGDAARFPVQPVIESVGARDFYMRA